MDLTYILWEGCKRMKKDMEEADDCWVQADKMRTRGQKGVIHARQFTWQRAANLLLDEVLRLA